MAKAAALHYSCSECGYSTGRWLGRCPGCASFGTLVEEGPPPAANGMGEAKPLLRLAEVEVEEAERIPTGVPELDRVLGGGLVPASLVLVGGEPGVGKSTLLLMALAAISRDRRALLVTGEESTAQVKLRAARLGGAERVEILAETNLETVCATLERERPDVCVIDSVQTLYSDDIGSAPGSVGQVREAAARLLRVGKESGVALFLVGHVTKDGSVAGPARARAPRRLRAPVRGRSVSRPPGLASGEEPFRLDERDRRLRDDRHRARGSARSVCGLRAERGRGGRGSRVRARGNPAAAARDPGARRADRPGDAAARRHRGRPEAPRDDRRRPLRHAGLALGQADVFVNVAGGVRIDEPGADLAVALAIASAARGAPVLGGMASFGEIGLTGRLRPAAQAERRAEECAKLGLTSVLVPKGTDARAGISLIEAETVRQALSAGLDKAESQAA